MTRGQTALEDFARTWAALRAELGDRAARALAEESNGRWSCRTAIALRCVQARLAGRAA